MTHRVYNRIAAREFIAAHLTEREVSAFEACGVPAMQADYFRYCAILKLGGVCSDADMRCIRPLQPLLESGPSGLLIRKPNGNVINGFFAFNAPEHPLLRMALDIATVNIERRCSNNVWLATGPGIFTLLARLRDPGFGRKFRSEYVDQDGPFQNWAQNVCEVLAKNTCIESLFEGVVVLPIMELQRYVRSCSDLPYKKTAEHWVNWQELSSIYSE